MTGGLSRRALTFGLPVAAAGAGLGLFAWRSRQPAADTERMDGGAGESATQTLWTQKFQRPGGGQLVMADLRGRPLVVNFWATWCPPCIRELPELQRFQHQFRSQGWQVVALAIDREAAVLEFLGRTPLDLTVALGGIEGTDLGMVLGNRQNGLPFSVMIDSKGRIVHRKAGQTSFDELAGWARGLATAT